MWNCSDLGETVPHPHASNSEFRLGTIRSLERTDAGKCLWDCCQQMNAGGENAAVGEFLCEPTHPLLRWTFMKMSSWTFHLTSTWVLTRLNRTPQMLRTSWNRADRFCPKGWGQSFKGAPLHVWGHCLNLCWHQPSFMEWSNVQPAPGHHYAYDTPRNSITAYNTVFGYSAKVTTATWTFSPNSLIHSSFFLKRVLQCSTYFPTFIWSVFFHWGMKKGVSEHSLSYFVALSI